jgi:hypothetical protein
MLFAEVAIEKVFFTWDHNRGDKADRRHELLSAVKGH